MALVRCACVPPTLKAEEERETTVEFLRLVNQSRGTRDLVQAATTFFQQRSACEAVGIRLQEGDATARGSRLLSSSTFVPGTPPARSSSITAAIPRLDCMCGNVICGRVDSSKPFFTANGSFWANDTTRLLATTTEADRQIRTRNRCNGEGYESVALIPLRIGEQRLGLLQLNDRQKGRFSLETILLWERLAGYLAAALSKFRAEEALRESEAQFRELAEGIPQLAWTAHPDGGIYWYNRRWYQYTGTTPEQMEGWGWQSVHDPNELPKVLERWKRSIATGEVFDMVFPLLGADGVFRPFLTRVMPLRDAQGRVVRWFGTNTDISDQRRAEQALRQQADMLRLSFDAILVWRLDGAIESWNVGAEQLYGYTESEALGRVSHELLRTIHPVPWQEIEAELRQYGYWEGELQHFTKDGREVVVSARKQLIRGADGIERVLESNRDITERKQAEEALRQSEERWATTLRSIGDAVISTCAQGKVIFMNDVAQTLTGWTLAEAQGKDMETVFNIVNEVTRIRPENPVSRVLRHGQTVGLANHTALIGRDGTEYPIEDSAAPIRNKDGEITGVVLVFHDVVEKRKAEKAVRNSERLATTGRLAATLAHEIHNPLDTVGNLLYLMDQAPHPGDARQYVALASQEVARVTQMTRHMLAFQRESNKPVPVNIAEILDSVVVLFERKIQSAGILVEKHVEFEQEFLGLPGEMRQVVANLFGNAVEAVGKNGKIRLSAYAAHNWRTGEFGLRIIVADDGPGIPANIRGKIFDPFFTTKGEAGTGLGLWITSGIVHNSGGTLRLRSTTRNGRTGTCFSVFLPIK